MGRRIKIVARIIQIWEEAVTTEWHKLQTSGGFTCQRSFCEFLLSQEKLRQHSLSHDNDELDQTEQPLFRPLSTKAEEITSINEEHCYSSAARDIQQLAYCVNSDSDEFVDVEAENLISFPDLELDLTEKLQSHYSDFESMDIIDLGDINPAVAPGSEFEVFDLSGQEQLSPLMKVRSIRRDMCFDREQPASADVACDQCFSTSCSYKCNVCDAVVIRCFMLIDHHLAEHNTFAMHLQDGLQLGTPLNAVSNFPQSVAVSYNGNSVKLKPTKITAAEKFLSCGKYFKCTICNRILKSQIAMDRHLRKLHGELGLPAIVVDENATELGVLKNMSAKSAFRFKCDICFNTFASKFILKRHCLRVHVKNENKENETEALQKTKRELTCQMCNQLFSSFYCLLKHDSAAHEGKSADSIKSGAQQFSLERNLHVCSVCCKILKYEVALTKHCLNMHKDVILPAPSVEGIMNNPIGNKTASTVKQRPFKCLKCKKSFAGKQWLEKHCLQYHKIDDDGYENRPVTTYLCDICGVVFVNQGFFRHRNQHLFSDAECCYVCGKYFKIRRHFRNHMRYHHPKGGSYKKKKCKKACCYICGDVLSSTANLTNHLAVHAGFKNHNCDDCGASFTTRRYLMRHRGIMHGAGVKKNHACSHCGQRYRDRMDRDWHVIKKHGTPEEVKEKWHLNPKRNKVYKKKTSTKL